MEPLLPVAGLTSMALAGALADSGLAVDLAIRFADTHPGRPFSSSQQLFPLGPPALPRDTVTG